MRSLAIALLLSLSLVTTGAAAQRHVPVASADQRCSFSFSGPVSQLLAELGRRYGRNVVGDSSLAQQTATITLQNVTFDGALSIIAHTFHLYRQDVDGTVYMAPGSANGSIRPMTFYLRNASATDVVANIQSVVKDSGTVIADERTNALLYMGSPQGAIQITSLLAVLDAGTSSSVTSTARIDLNHTTPTIAMAELRGALGTRQNTLTIVATTNALIITGPQGMLAQAKSLVAQFDQPTPQVNVQVTVYDVTPRNEQKNIGLQFGSGTAQPTSGFSPNIFGISIGKNYLGATAVLNTLFSTGTAKVLANPNTVVHVGELGHMMVGSTYPSVFQNGGLTGGTTVTTVNSGVILDVTPILIGADGSVDLRIHAEYSQITGFVQTYPILGNRSVDTVLTAHSGQPIIFGGLTQDNESHTTQKIPLLGDIPLFGALFRNVQTTNLQEQIVFTITPIVEKQ